MDCCSGARQETRATSIYTIWPSLICSSCYLMVQRLGIKKWRNSLCPHALQSCRMLEAKSPMLCPQSQEIASSRAVRPHRNPLRSHVRDSHAGDILYYVVHCGWYCVIIRVWRRSDRHRGQLQLSQPPRLLPPQPAVCVGDQGATPLPSPDSSVVPGCGGTLPLSVWLVGAAGTEWPELCGHQVGPEEFQLLLLQRPGTFHPGITPKVGTFLRNVFVHKCSPKFHTLGYLELISFEFLFFD